MPTQGTNPSRSSKLQSQIRQLIIEVHFLLLLPLCEPSAWQLFAVLIGHGVNQSINILQK
jgi:pSer/pThr/pTyr-binding forkhead associated (FHA) protein